MRGERQPDSEPASNYPPARSTDREVRGIKGVRDEAADGDRRAQVGEALISRP